jgi:hypothetical protein
VLLDDLKGVEGLPLLDLGAGGVDEGRQVGDVLGRMSVAVVLA